MGTVITLGGSGFSTVNEDNVVTIGGSPCVVQTSAEDNITCRAGKRSGYLSEHELIDDDWKLSSTSI